jgi:hypothetical protein
MAPTTHRKSVTVARIKTAAVQGDVQQAEADLHEANDVLADTVVGTVVTKESVQAALLQNLQVEGQLHDAVKELQVVTDLLKTAEQEKAAHGSDDSAKAGSRSGEGVSSVLEHMAPAARPKDAAR